MKHGMRCATLTAILAAGMAIPGARYVHAMTSPDGAVRGQIRSDEAAGYLGRYEQDGIRGDVIVDHQDGFLVVRLPGRSAMRLMYAGNHAFSPEHRDNIKLVFDVKDGRAVGYTFFEPGGERTGKRVGPLPTSPVEDPQNTGGGWVLEELDLTVDIKPDEQCIAISGKARIHLDIDRSFGPSFAINKEILRFDSVNAAGDPKVTLNEPHAVHPKANAVHLRFDKPFSRGDLINVEFACHTTGTTDSFALNEQVALGSWTQFWTPLFLPKPGEGPSPALLRAPGTTTVRVPVGWRTLTNGRFLERTETSDVATETWAVEIPVARSFVAGDYTVARHDVDGREVAVYLLSPKPMSGSEQVNALGAALAAMEARFGPYPYPRYAVAEVPEGLTPWYASSEQGFIMAKSEAFQYEGGNLPLFAHEMAHGWWGNLVNERGPGGIVCSESLAQYSAVIAIETIEGFDAATGFLRFSRTGYSSRQCARGYFQLAGRGQDRPLSELESGGWQHDLSDAKGHWIFHMLRRRVGDDTFFATLRTLLRDYAGREMALDDIRAAFLRAAPDARLTQFFAQWLDRKGAPVLDVDWSPVGSDKCRVIITQSQAGASYDLDVDVAIDTDGATVMHTVRLTEASTVVVLPARGTPTGVRLDPEHRLLIWTPEYGPMPQNPR